MEFLSQDKLVISGSAGMIGSNMAQTAAMMHLTPNICLYDPYEPALKGVYEEIMHCGFEGMNFTFTPTSRKPSPAPNTSSARAARPARPA